MIMDLGPDRIYGIGHSPVTHKFRFYRDWVGPQTYIDIEEADYTYTNANSIFADLAAGDDDTGDGTQENPYQTIAKAASMCTVICATVIVLSDGLYEEDFTNFNNYYFEGVYAATGIDASYTHRSLGYTPSDSNTIYVKKTGSDTNAGTAAAPKLTVEAADAAASGKKVVIQDSGTYLVNGRTIVADGWYAALGVRPTIQPVPTTVISGPSTTGTFNSGYHTGNTSSIKLKNGNFVIAWYRSTGSGSGMFNVYNASGSLVNSVTFKSTIAVPKLTLLNNGNFVVVYGSGTPYYGYFQIYDQAGNQIKSETRFNTSSSVHNGSFDICTLPNGNFVIAYKDYSDIYGYFEIFDQSGNQIKSKTLFCNSDTYIGNVHSSSNGNFMISYSAGIFIFMCVYNASGTLVKSAQTVITFPSSVGPFSSCTLDNGNFAIAYQNTSGYGACQFYDPSGNNIKSETVFVSSPIAQIKIVGMINNNFLACYNSSSNFGTFCLVNSSGAVASPTTISSLYLNIVPLSACRLDNDDFVVVGSENDLEGGRFVLGSWFKMSSYTISAEKIFNGIIFDGDNHPYLNRLFNGSAKINSYYCEYKNIERPDNDSNVFVVYSTAEVNSQKNQYHDNARGIYAVSNKATIKHDIYYGMSMGPGVHIAGAAAASGDITVEYSTFYQNSSGLCLENNNGANEVVKNNIFSGNSNYDIFATNATTCTYSIIVGTATNVTSGSGVTKANPLFLDEADFDLNLKSKIVGDPVTSPGYQLSDSTSPDRDAGAWDVAFVGEGTTWTYFEADKPITGVDRLIDFIGAVETKKKSGDIETSFDAMYESIAISHSGIKHEDVMNWLAAIYSKKNQIQFYPNPLTNPTVYQIYKLVYKKIKVFGKAHTFDSDFKNDFVVEFERTFELE